MLRREKFTCWTRKQVRYPMRFMYKLLYSQKKAYMRSCWSSQRTYSLTLHMGGGKRLVREKEKVVTPGQPKTNLVRPSLVLVVTGSGRSSASICGLMTKPTQDKGQRKKKRQLYDSYSALIAYLAATISSRIASMASRVANLSSAGTCI